MVRIFGINSWLKWFLIVITGFKVVASVILVITSWTQVRPVQALWNPLILAKRISANVVAREGNVTGGNYNKFYTLHPPSHSSHLHTKTIIILIFCFTALFSLGDLCYVLLPVIVVWKNMQFRQKLGLILLLALSLFTMGGSIAKGIVVESGTQATSDKQYKSLLALLWSVTEQTCVIMIGCAPPLR